jgi:hypothetical protein
MTYDRPFSPPGAEIMAQCFDAFADFESRYSEDLEEIDDVNERAIIYGYVLDGIDIDLAKAMAARDLHHQ